MEVLLLSSGPIKVIRDAARAVKRKAKLVIRTGTNQYIEGS
jgi:hypothetical protein